MMESLTNCGDKGADELERMHDAEGVKEKES